MLTVHELDPSDRVLNGLKTSHPITEVKLGVLDDTEFRNGRGVGLCTLSRNEKFRVSSVATRT